MADAKSREILFVFQGRTRQSKRDRELEASAIRSHAARNSKRGRRKAAQRTARVGLTTEAALEPPSPNLPIWTPVKLPSIPALLDWQPANAVGDALERSKEKASKRRSPEAPSPLSILGQGRIDPFGTSSTALLPTHILEYLDFAYEVVWPAILPVAYECQAELLWKSAIQEEPRAFATHVVAAASLAAKLASDPVIVQNALKLRRVHRQRSLDWINDEINNPSGPPSDRLISATLIIMYHNKERIIGPCQKYRQTPLATVKSLHLFGGSNVLPEDLSFLYKLVELKGGVENIKSVAVRSFLTLADVIFATRHACRPSLILAKDFADQAEPRPACPSYFRSTTSLAYLGVGFGFVQDDALMHALQACCDLTVDLAHFQEQLPSSPSFEYLGHRAVGVQHALCSLDLDPATESDKAPLTSIVRLGALLYSDIVLFPMPPAVGVRTRLLDELRTALEQVRDNIQANERYDVWLWAVVIGATGSIMRDGQSSWFTDMLRQQSSHPRIGFSWPRLKSIVTRFLWWEYILDAPALDAWTCKQPLMIIGSGEQQTPT